MVSLALGFASGISMYWHFAGQYGHGLMILVTVLMACAGTVFYFQQQSDKPASIYASILCMGFALGLGILWAWLSQSWQPQWQVNLKDRQAVHTLKGLIVTLPAHHRRYSSFTMKLSQMDGESVHGYVKVYWSKGGRQAHVGQIWQLQAKLKPVIGVHNIAGIDREKIMFRQGIAAVGSVQTKQRQILLDSGHGMFIQRIRSQLSQQIGQYLQGNSMKGVIQALTVADKRNLDPSLYRIFQRTGTGHLLVISGLHIGMVAGFAWLFSGLIWSFFARSGRINKQTVQAVIALLAGCFYATLAGFSVPTIRATIMLAVASITLIRYYRAGPWRAWSIAMLCVCLLDAKSVLSPGFVLSFAAVASLLLLMTVKRAPTGWVKSQLKTGAWFIFAMMPITIMFFQQVSILGYFVNLIAIPWVMLMVVPLSLLGLSCLYWWPGAAKFFLVWAATGMHWLTSFMKTIADWPWAFWHHAMPNYGVLALATLGILLVFLPKRFPGRMFAWLLICPMILPWRIHPGAGILSMTVLDVGQGLAIILQTSDHVMLYDTGPSHAGGGNAGADIVVPVLRQYGIQKIDRIMVSHGDDDHAGGYSAIKEAYSTDDVLLGEPIRMHAPMAQACLDGQHWQWDGVAFAVIHPTLHTKKGNNRSCVLKITVGKASVLIPGDLETKGEKRLLKKHGKDLPATVLIAGHHGSKSSSSLPFVNKVKPKWLVFSTGYLNQYGFPHTQIKQRYSDIGAHAFNTANCGSIRMTIYPDGRLLSSFERQTNTALWSWQGGQVGC